MTEPMDLEALRIDGRRSTAVWGAAAGAGVVGIVLAYFLYAYLYLSVSSDEWPPVPVPDPPLLRPFLLLGALTVSAAVALWASRRHAAGDVRAATRGLATVAAIGALVIVAGSLSVAELGLEPRERAYGAIVSAVHAVQGLATGAGVIIAALGSFESHRLGRHPWVAAATLVSSIWWCTVAAGWAAVFGVVYVWPQLP